MYIISLNSIDKKGVNDTTLMSGCEELNSVTPFKHLAKFN